MAKKTGLASSVIMACDAAMASLLTMPNAPLALVAPLDRFINDEAKRLLPVMACVMAAW